MSNKKPRPKGENSMSADKLVAAAALDACSTWTEELTQLEDGAS